MNCSPRSLDFFLAPTISLLCSVFLLVPAAARAEGGAAEEPRRGLVTSASCPLSCEELRVPEKDCRSWSAGERCYVEDMRSPAGHRSLARVNPRAMMQTGDGLQEQTVNSSRNQLALPVAEQERRGLVTTSTCPYTCADAGVPLEHCRSSSVGSQCRVEDLRQPAGHRSMVRVP